MDYELNSRKRKGAGGGAGALTDLKGTEGDLETRAQVGVRRVLDESFPNRSFSKQVLWSRRQVSKFLETGKQEAKVNRQDGNDGEEDEEEKQTRKEDEDLEDEDEDEDVDEDEGNTK